VFSSQLSKLLAKFVFKTSCRRAAATIFPHPGRYTSCTHMDRSPLLCPYWPASTTNQSGLVTLTSDLLTLKVVSESRVTWSTSVPILVFLGLCSRVTPDVRDRQTDVRQKHRLMPPPIRGGGIKTAFLYKHIHVDGLPESCINYHWQNLSRAATGMCKSERQTFST